MKGRGISKDNVEKILKFIKLYNEKSINKDKEGRVNELGDDKSSRRND